MSEPSRDENILDENLGKLLEKAHDPPRIDRAARARIFDNLSERVAERAAARESERDRAGLFFTPQRIGIAAVAIAATVAAVVVLRGDTGPQSVHTNDAAAPERVALDDGSALILDAGTEVAVLGPREIRVRRGRILLDVAKDDERFRVHSPHGEIAVLGTRFVVDVADDKTVTSVIRGVVEIANASGSTTLRAGQQGEFTRTRAPTRRMAPRLSHLAGWAKSARLREESADRGPVRNGTLLARNPNWQENDFPLPMRELTVDVEVDNQIARVAVDQTFFNPQRQQLEGVYRFPLPANAAISRLAMYVEGKRMEAAIVERQRGREIYESIVYRRRDPALLEWMAGNQFQMRIFPLPARTEKRIVMSYTQSLERLYGDYRLEVPIPEIDQPVGEVTYRVRVADCAGCEIRSTSHPVEVSADGDDALVTFAKSNYAIGDDLLLTIRDGRESAARVAAAGRYWMMRATPPVADGAEAEHVRRRWVILHDTSASRGALERKAQVHLIDRFLDEADEDDEVDILAFDTTVRRFGEDFSRVGDLTRGDLAPFLSAESGDGVGYTDLAAVLDEAAELLDGAADDGVAPHILYLGDGIVTGGERELDELRAHVAGVATFVGVAVGDRMDETVLRGLAAATGGMFATMNPGDDLDWRLFDLLAALNTPRVTDLEVTLLDGEGQPISDAQVYPGRQALADGEEIAVVAALGKVRPSAVRLAGLRGDEVWTHVVELDGAGVDREAGYLARLWAQRRIAALMSDGADENTEELVALGTEHFLMTPHTSLLVLENDAMYREYDVERDGSHGWAAYELPETIDVVHEPIGTGSARRATAGAILHRSPTTPLSWGTQGWGDGWGGRHTVTLNTRGFRDANVFLDGRAIEGFATVDLGGTIGRGSGTGRGFGAGGGGRVTASLSQLEVTEARAAEKSLRASSGPMPAGDISGAADQTVAAHVSTDELTAQPMSWRVGGEGKSAGFDRNNAQADAPTSGARWREDAGGFAFDNEMNAARAFAEGDEAKKGKGRYWGGYGPSAYYRAPYPTAYHYAGDPRLRDLTELVPGFYDGALDVAAADLRSRAGDPGTITDGARRLLDRARAAATAQRYRWPSGRTLEVDARGRFVLTRELATGLDERIVYDGATLRHVYEELGLVISRDVSDIASVVTDIYTPWRLPDADALVRWYDVTATDDDTLRLARAGGKGTGYVEYDLDRTGSVERVRTVVSGETISDVVYERDGGTLAVEAGESRVEIAAAAGGALDLGDASASTVVTMPLRHPAHWAAELEGLEAGSDAWRALQVQSLAAYAALGNESELRVIAEAIAEHSGALRRGELALASRGVAAAPTAEVNALTEPLAGDAVSAYVRGSRRFLDGGAPSALHAVADDHEGTLAGMLARYRGALAEMHSRYDKNASERRVKAFLDEYTEPSFGYILVQQFSSRWYWQHPNDTVAMWDRLAEGPMDYVAGYEAGRILYQRGKYDDAVARFEKLLARTDVPPRLDNIVKYAYQNSSRGIAGWQSLWTGWRNDIIKRGDLPSLTALLGAALAAGEHVDIDRIVARITELDIERPAEAAAVSDTLFTSGRYDQALAVLRPFLAKQKDVDGDPVTAGLLARASTIAEQQGRFDEAAGYLERALDAQWEDGMELHQVRAAYQRLIRLRIRVAQTARDDARDRAADRALDAVAAWRRVDPHNAAIDRLAAQLLYAIQRPDRAWRYLTTAIERAPMQGSSYQTVAEVLEAEGRLAEAEPLWRRAYQVEPTNPTWLLRRAQNLRSAGSPDQAAALIDRIVDREDEWHERFFRVVYQAKQIKNAR